MQAVLRNEFFTLTVDTLGAGSCQPEKRSRGGSALAG